MDYYLTFLFTLTILFISVGTISQKPILIIVSYDAFRYNYFLKNATPNMERLRNEGSTTDYVFNVFPTKTNVNHFSIATGLFPEVHGVVGNKVYDPKDKKEYSYGYELFHYSDDVLPIWTLNEKSGQGRHSGVMMWPGSEFQYQNINATFRFPWDPNVLWETRIDTVITWLTHPTTPANLIMIYFEEPDTIGHAYGPESETVLKMLNKLDNITSYLEKQLIKNGLREIANVIHLSDHGMSSVSPPNFIDITQFLEPNTYKLLDTSPCLHLIPENGKEEEIYNLLLNASITNKHFSVYKKNNILERWHFKNNRRTPPIFLLADLEYGFQDLADAAKAYEKEYGIKITPTTKYGVHGYDNKISSMHPFFMARGPAIKKNHKVPPFHIVDLYNLFCNILKLVPSKNNGTFLHVADMISDNIDQKDTTISSLVMAVGGALLSFLFLGCVGSTMIFLMKCKQRTESIPLPNRRYANQFPAGADVVIVESQQLLISDSDEA